MSKELTLIPALPNTPGWVALSQTDREWLQEHTSNAVQNFRESGFKAIQACAELGMIENFLQDKPMTMTHWIRNCFGASEATARRWLANYKEMRGSSSDEAILYLAKEGIAGLNNVQVGTIAPVLKRLPAPKNFKDEKAVSEWKEQVGAAIRRSMSARSKGHRANRIDPDEAGKMFVVETRRLIKEVGFETNREAKSWLVKHIGYAMETCAIPGALTAERTPPPDGWLPKRGRPRIIEGKKGKVA